MKRATILAIVFIFLAAPSFAALPEPIDKGVHKIKAGTWDLLSVPYGIGKGTYDHTKASTFKPLGLVEGVLRSSTDGAKKAITAAVDIATFPFEMVKK